VVAVHIAEQASGIDDVASLGSIPTVNPISRTVGLRDSRLLLYLRPATQWVRLRTGAAASAGSFVEIVWVQREGGGGRQARPGSIR